MTERRPCASATRLGVTLAVLVVCVSCAWLFWPSAASGESIFVAYARAAVLATVFAGTCLVAGHALLVKIWGRSLPFEEHLALASAFGVFAFFLMSCAFGFAGYYGTPFLILGPLLLLAFGWQSARRTLSRLRRHLTHARLQLRLSSLQAALLGLGVLGVGLVWMGTLSPENASYDARWYHLSLAEGYVARGGIRAFPEGWVHAGFPQLASLLYAWPFSLAGSAFQRVVCAAQLELVLFLMTLVGVAALVRRCLGRRAPLGWLSVLLFPGIFGYDSSLVLGADHVAALWAAPIFLLLLRFRERREQRAALLLGAMIAGALDTKYTAMILLPLPVAVLTADALRRRGRAAWSVNVWLLSAVVILTAPHWLKNIVFYGDPLFPVLRRWLPAHPWQAAAEAPYADMFALDHPTLSVRHVLESLPTLLTFSFIPHDFIAYHGRVPVFGSLFSLFTPLVWLFPRKPRLPWLLTGAYLGLLAWLWLHEADRYLQVLVPWMAAATGVIIGLVWQLGGALRLLIALPIALQVAWGATVPFRFVHRMAGAPMYRVVLQLLARGSEADPHQPPSNYAVWEGIGRLLPQEARLLVHDQELHVGVAHVTLGDIPGDQGAFYWGEPGSATPSEIWRQLHARGVTHLAWVHQQDSGRETLAGSLLFLDFAEHHTRRSGSYGGFDLAELETEPSATAAGALGSVAYYPCDPDPRLAPGLYPVAALASARSGSTPAPMPWPEAAAKARFLVLGEPCHEALPRTLRRQFQLLARRGPTLLLERRQSR